MLDAGGVSDDSLDAQALWPMQDMWMQLRHAATRDSCTSVLLKPSATMIRCLQLGTSKAT